MKILILGANGKVGSRVAKQLIARGHTVVAGVHKNTKNIPKEATIAPININDRNSFTKALENTDAVVCTLSSWNAPNHNVLSIAMKSLIPAMQQAGIKRIVSVSGDIALLPGEDPDILVKIARSLLFGSIRRIVEDSQDHLRQLYESNLDWTVIRPTIMSSSKHSAYSLTNKHPLNPLVPREAVVSSIVDLLETPSHIHEAPYIITA